MYCRCRFLLLVHALVESGWACHWRFGVAIERPPVCCLQCDLCGRQCLLWPMRCDGAGGEGLVGSLERRVGLDLYLVVMDLISLLIVGFRLAGRCAWSFPVGEKLLPVTHVQWVVGTGVC